MSTSTIDLQQTAQSKHVVRCAGIVSVAVGISRLTGLVREIILAHFFGAGLSFDAFVLAFRIPNLTRELFAEGALSSAFIPRFAATLARHGEREAAIVANLVSSATILVVGAFSLFGIMFAPELVHLLAPGFAVEAGKTELAIRLTRIMFPLVLIMALAAQATGVLNTYNRFGVAALASTLFNLGSVLVGLAIGFWAGPHLGISKIEGMGYGVVVGALLQLAWQLPLLYRYGYRFRLMFDWAHPALRRIGQLMVPALLGNVAVQINVVVNTSFASRIADPLRGYDGPVSWLGYALRFVHLPLGLFGVAVASAMLPAVARDAAMRDFPEFKKTLSRSLGVVFLCSAPSTVALLLLGKPIVRAVFQSGRFNAYDTNQTALALSFYAVGLLAFAATRVLNPAFYALGDARTPMYASLLSIALNLAIPFALLYRLHFGFASLALTTSLAVSIESLLLFASLRRKLGGIEGRYLLDRLTRICCAAAVMAVAIAALNALLRPAENPDRWIALLETCCALFGGVMTFVLTAAALGIQEIRLALDAFLFPFRRLMGEAHARIRV
jgi:putative peptidoglycan lipid II flippase